MDAVIVTGMHRSGTTMLTEVMERLGVLMGHRKDPNHESIFFQWLNMGLLRSAGARWDAPAAWEAALDDQEMRRLYAEYLTGVLESCGSAVHLGLMRYLKHRSPLRYPGVWGWKDPRNTLTVPIWIDVLRGRARIVNVRRHGVDVARSLVTRQKSARQEAASSYARAAHAPGIFWLRPLKRDFVDSVRCSTMEGAFSLWVEYSACFERIKPGLGVPILDVTYEGILSDPQRWLAEFAAFSGVKPDRTAMEQSVARLRSARAFAFSKSAEDCEFAERHARDLARFGYSATGSL